jgi:3-hydroxybutyryl-CoA dehydrogenase
LIIERGVNSFREYVFAVLMGAARVCTLEQVIYRRNSEEGVKSMSGMNLEPLSRVGVVGCGLMGAGIAEVCARQGLDVVVIEDGRDAAARGLERIAESLRRAEARQKIESASAVLDRIRVIADLDALADRELVVEAIVEVEAAKAALFERLDEIVTDEHAILASNTSSIPIMKLGVATQRPSQVMGIHFFNPVPILALVELVPSLLTSAETSERARDFVTRQLGKQAIDCQDRAGFVVNALLVPFILSAIRMLESGFATAEAIDQGLVLGAAHPQGPLALADLIGLDTTQAIANSLYEEFKESLYAPPPLLGRMVDAGLVGRKIGRGFYEYET